MIRTRLCTLLEIEHPIVLGGMASGATGPALVAAVSNAGGLGTLGLTGLSAETIREHMAAIRSATDKPFAVNFLLFLAQPGPFEAAVAERPAVMAFAWARQDQELRDFFDPAHESGAKVMYQAVDVPDACRAAAAGADLIVAQGFEGGGHRIGGYQVPSPRIVGPDDDQAVSLFVEAVVGQFIVHVEPNEQATRHPYGQPQDVDRGVERLPSPLTQRNFDIVGQHKRASRLLVMPGGLVSHVGSGA